MSTTKLSVMSVRSGSRSLGRSQAIGAEAATIRSASVRKISSVCSLTCVCKGLGSATGKLSVRSSARRFCPRSITRDHEREDAAELNSKAELIVLSPAQSNLDLIGWRQRIVSDQAVLVGWHIEELNSILSPEKLPFTHRPTPSMINRPGALSSRTDEEIKTGALQRQSTRIGCRCSGATVSS